MFVTCHMTFGLLSNFVGASLEVTRTIRNNKLHFTWGYSILLLKKEKGPETGPPFFSMILTFFKYLRAHDWKCRESLARLKKSKILIIFLENPFREIYSKKIFQSLKNKKNQNLDFYLINYAKNTVFFCIIN